MVLFVSLALFLISLFPNFSIYRNVSKLLQDSTNATTDACATFYSKWYLDFRIDGFETRKQKSCNDYGINIGKSIILEKW